MTDMDLKHRVAYHTEHWRVSRGLKKGELAQRAGMLPQQLSRILGAEFDIRSTTIDALAKALGVDVALLTLEVPEEILAASA